MIGYSKNNRENYPKNNAFHTKKKKPRLKFSPGLALTGVLANGPSELSILAYLLVVLCCKNLSLKKCTNGKLLIQYIILLNRQLIFGPLSLK